MATPTPLEVLAVTPVYSSSNDEVAALTEKLILEIAGRDNFHFTWAAATTAKLPDMPGQSLLPLPTLVPFDKFGVVLWRKNAIKKLTAALANADILWLHGTRFLGARKIQRVAAQMGRPVVTTETEGPVPNAGYGARARNAFWDLFSTLPILRAADRALFSNDRVADDYFARAQFARTVSVVPYGVDFRTFHPPLIESRRYLRQSFALRADQPVLMYAGPLETRRGLDVLRALARLLPGWRFWLAGQGAVDPTKWLLPNVHVFKDRTGPALAELYQAADVLVIPSSGPRFPACIQEAMACGLPVLCPPEVAEGARPALSHLHLAHAFPGAPERTARSFADYLQHFPLPLPRLAPDDDAADFAASAWDWPPLADAYAEIFRDVRRARLST